MSISSDFGEVGRQLTALERELQAVANSIK
jgi:hypothetical protein